MNCRYRFFISVRHQQSGASLIVALVMLLVLTLLGLSSMNTAVVEMKMSASLQQQIIAMNTAEEMLTAVEQKVEAIIADASVYDFEADNDGYYVAADEIDVRTADWTAANFAQKSDDTVNDGTGTDLFVVEYLGYKPIPDESLTFKPDGRVAGGAVHSFRISTRSEAGKNAVRILQSNFVTAGAP